MSLDLLTNLLAALIFFTAGLAVQWLRDRYRRTRPAEKVWRNPRGADFSVVVADGPTDANGNTSVHPAESAAATELSSFLAQSFKANASRVSVSAEFPGGAAIQENLIVIGGPIHNSLYRTVAANLTIAYEFQGKNLVSETRNQSFTPVNSKDGRPEIDYGLVVISTNPYNPDALVVLLAGCRTFGCLGAARALVGPLIPQIAPLVSKGGTCCLVVKMDVLAGWVGRLEIVDHVLS